MTALHDLTIKAIRRAQAKGGTIDPVEDWLTISELDKLARAMTEVSCESRLLYLDLPIVISDIKLYRLSWGAMDWVTQCASLWFKDALSYDRALAWAHAHARSPRAFLRCTNSRDAHAEVSQWARGLSAPWQAIMIAVDELLSEIVSSDQADKKSKSARTSDGPVLESLMNEYGKPVEYWLWDLSAAAFMSLIKAHSIRIDRINGESSRIAGKAPDPDGSYAKTTIRFQREARLFVDSVVARGKIK